MSEEKDNTGMNGDDNLEGDNKLHEVVNLSGMYENWFLDYASYVILERAVPVVLPHQK